MVCVTARTPSFVNHIRRSIAAAVNAGKNTFRLAFYQRQRQGFVGQTFMATVAVKLA